MTFDDWQQLGPADAARLLRRRLAHLSPQQRRAVFATVATEEELWARFTAAASEGPLRGVPYFLKDLFDVAGLPTLAGSTFLAEVRPEPRRDSAMVRALRGVGAVLAGKTHLHEFAYGLTGENPHYGDCEHPNFPGRTSGGSSSGSAAAVAAGIVPLAIGTDTGGSIRVPAAFCGLFGFRMTPHHAWVEDAFPLAPSFDTAGWFTRHAADMRQALGALLETGAEISTPRGCWVELPGLDADVAAAFRSAAEAVTGQADAATRTALLEAFAPAADAYVVLGGREAWSVHEGWIEQFGARYDPAVRTRLEQARDLRPDQIATAEAARTTLRRTWREFFRTYDFLVLPATPCAALTKNECTVANRTRLLALTAPVSLTGWPALVVPVALPSGLSTGLQIVVQDPRSSVLRTILAETGP